MLKEFYSYHHCGFWRRRRRRRKNNNNDNNNIKRAVGAERCKWLACAYFSISSRKDVVTGCWPATDSLLLMLSIWMYCFTTKRFSTVICANCHSIKRNVLYCIFENIWIQIPPCRFFIVLMVEKGTGCVVSARMNEEGADIHNIAGFALLFSIFNKSRALNVDRVQENQCMLDRSNLSQHKPGLFPALFSHPRLIRLELCV